MRRISASITITNLLDQDKQIRCDALVDTGASHLTLPAAWKERLGRLEEYGVIDLETATGKTVSGVVCAPVRVQIRKRGQPPF